MNCDFLRESTDSGDVLDIPMKFKTYEVMETIGTGSYAVVVGVRDTAKNMLLAAKVMKRPTPNTEGMRLLERELRLCENVCSRFLVSCVDVVYMRDLIVLVMERCAGKDLLTVIMESRHLVAGNWKGVFVQICMGVQYLHSHGLSHRDLKPENIMVDENMNCKLCDYGLMCEVKNGTLSRTKFGTVPYMAPEMLLSETYNGMAADVWALGVILYVIVTGCIPWQSESDIGMSQEIARGINCTSALTESQKAIVLMCCQVYPEKRATIDQVVQSTFLKTDVMLKPRSSLPIVNIMQKKIESGSQRIIHPNVKRVDSTLKLSAGTSHPQVRIIPKIPTKTRIPVGLSRRFSSHSCPAPST